VTRHLNYRLSFFQLVLITLILAQFSSLLLATESDRKVLESQEIKIECSPTQEDFVQALYPKLIGFSQALTENRQSIRNDILKVIETNATYDLTFLSKAIGNAKYDENVRQSYIKRLDTISQIFTKISDTIMPYSSFTVWEKADLVEKLKNGYDLNYFTYNSTDDTIEFAFKEKINGIIPMTGGMSDINNIKYFGAPLIIPIITKFKNGQTIAEALQFQRQYLHKFGELVL
jgi:hypothetical protein